MIAHRHLRLLTGLIVILVAILHLAHQSAGFPALVTFIDAGTPFIDPRPIAFTLSGAALIIGTLAVWNGYIPRREAYLAGMAMLAVYLLGYIVWHLTGHGGFWPYLEGRHHDGNPIMVMFDHLRHDEWERTAKLLELIGLSVLGYLYHVEFRSDATQEK